VIRGTGTSSDGRGVSVYAPNTVGQRRAFRRALRAAGIAAHEVDLIEAHGAGTKLGDKTEIESYAAVYGDRDASLPISLGTVKSQIGHLSGAAGMVGLLKVALALREKTLPPSNGEPDPELPFGKLPLELSTQPRPWVSPPNRLRRAAVTAIGLGGSNHHVILEEHLGQGEEERQESEVASRAT
jgi:acyl transferase domain-containing protein